MVKLTVNNMPVEVEDGATILDAATKTGIKIPTLCHMHLDSFDVEHRCGSCRICVVEVEGRRNLAPSCCTPASEGMKVKTNSIRAINARRTIMDLILSNHPKDCLTCERNGSCDLQKLAGEMDLHQILYEGEMSKRKKDLSSKAIVRDTGKCIMCRRCETACNVMQTVGILSGIGRGFDVTVGTAGRRLLEDTECTFCGQCVAACPVGALTEMNYVYNVWSALNDPSKTVIVQTAPAVRVAIGEEFGMEPGSISTGQLVHGLRLLGFDKIFDTNFAADLTIMEETHELVERITKNENLPILTSCCPGWVKFLEHQFPELTYMPSSAKSPQQMFGAIAKSYYAEKINKKPEDIVVVSVMPCLAKKYEATRPEFAPDGVPDVDIVISTRELASMFKEAGVNINNLEPEEYDSPLGDSTGAAMIFGASGGVLEAALRTAADQISGEDLESIDFKSIRGLEGVKEATVNVAGMDLKVAVCSGLGNARKVLEKIKRGEASYHAIEIMACPGGCLNGGGQPYIHGDTSILERRKEAIYKIDKDLTIRKSHQNPDIIKLYDEYLGKPGSPKAHKLLHTEYVKREHF
ncbi:MAG: NADH-dependent [FeFe] hydrogenase, group A6 [Victivallaceae bacterium]|nr:NADH-dependent [FeFe] hydrogenase, group A6 [Victivallaceae bacterium]